MNIPVVIQTLRELADWLECSKQNQNDFIGDGTTYAWWNYLIQVADICQKNL